MMKMWNSYYVVNYLSEHMHLLSRQTQAHLVSGLLSSGSSDEFVATGRAARHYEKVKRKWYNTISQLTTSVDPPPR